MALVITDIRKRFGRKIVLRGASLRCELGEVCALTGENGSGKSTLLSIVAGLLSPDGGGAEIEGAPLCGRHASGRERIGFVPEKANPPGRMTARQVLDLVGALKRAEGPSPTRQQELGIDHLLRRPISALSLGERRRVCLAAALIGKPSLLLLDEPTNGLDSRGAAMFRTLIAEAADSDVAVLIATHDRSLIEETGARELRLEGGALL